MTHDIKIRKIEKERQHGLLNLIALSSCVFLLIFYIIQVNWLVSQEYKLNLLKIKFGKVLEEQNRIQAERLHQDGIPQIVQFARKAGMVEATNSAYIFEDGSVAQR